jgi:hypothetical protein
MSRYDKDEHNDNDRTVSAHDHDQEQQRRRLSGVSGWLLSLAAHGLIAMVLTSMVIFQEMEQEHAPIQPVVLEPPEEQEQEEIVDQEFEEVQVTVQAEALQEQEMEEIELPQEIDLGVEEDVGDFDVMMGNQGSGDDLGDLNGDGGFMNSAIGVGGGSGAFMNRQGGNKKRALVPRGRRTIINSKIPLCKSSSIKAVDATSFRP